MFKVGQKVKYTKDKYSILSTGIYKIKCIKDYYSNPISGLEVNKNIVSSGVWYVYREAISIKYNNYIAYNPINKPV